MKKLLIVFLILISGLVQATNYVVGTGGTYTTVAQVNSAWAAGTFNSGDSILFKRGETFFGNLIAGESGTLASNIIIGAYGATNLVNPIITGFTQLSTWADQGSNIWKATVPTVNNVIKTVIINGKQYAIGRYPNTGWLTYESNVDDVSITDAQLTGTPNWTGAECVLRRIKWTLEVCPITNHGGSTLTLTFPTTAWSSSKGYGYFIQNDIRTLDAFGEWYFNGSTKELSMYSVGNPSTGKTIQVSTLDTIITVTNYNYITFTDLTIEGSNDNAIVIQNGKYITVKNCNVNYSGESAVTTTTASLNAYLIADNNVINHANCNAFQINNSTSRVWIKNNTIKNINPIKGSSASGYVGDGIMFHCPGIVEYNILDSIGHSGIVATSKDSMVVQYNNITHYGQSRYDCGGIYLWCNQGTVQKGVIIKQNIVHHCTPFNEGVANSPDLGVRGICLDEYVQNHDIDGNIVFNIENEGIYTLRAKNNTIRNNISFNNQVQIGFKYAYGKDYHITGMSVTDNIFVAKLPTQLTFEFYTAAASSDIPLFGVADRNIYARPIDDNLIISTTYNSSTTVTRTLVQWKTFSGQDANSSGSIISDTTGMILIYNSTPIDKVIPLTGFYRNFKGRVYTNKLTLSPYTSELLFPYSGDGTGYNNINSFSKPKVNP